MTLDPVSSGDPHVPAHNAERAAINALQAGLDTKISLPPGAATGDLLRWDGVNWVTTETRFFEGNGGPNGVIAAPIGSRYIDKTGAQGANEWIKASGTGNTGWQVNGQLAAILFKGYKNGGNVPAGAPIPWLKEFLVGEGAYANGLFTVARPGKYRLYSVLKHDGTSGEVGLGFVKNGAMAHWAPNIPNGGYMGSQTTTVLDCVANDTLGVRIQTAVNLQNDAPAQNSIFLIEYVCA